MLTTLELWIIIIGMAIPFIATALGAAAVFFFRGPISERVNSILLGFAAGVMIAASVWSLIMPSLEFAENSGWGKLAIIPVAVGFALGVLFLWYIDRIVPHMHQRSEDEEGLPT